MSTAVTLRFAAVHGTSHRFARRRVRQLRQTLRPIYVFAVGTDRCYGGPEEGGWWYDQSFVIDVASCRGWKRALRAVRSLKSKYPTCPYGRFSAAGGTDVVIRVTDTLEDIEQWDYPKERPRYC